MELKAILREISAYERTFKRWEERAAKIVKRYTGETTKATAPSFNILWANVETLVPAVFARIPQPEVTRRFKDKDAVGRVASLILERALEFEVQHYDDYKNAMLNSVKDRFLGGRGVSWVRYEPRFKQEQLQVSEDSEESFEALDYECAPVDYVHWKDFGHQCARSWEEVKMVWRKVYMTYDELVERFGEEVADGTPLDQKQMESERASDISKTASKATIYEVWHKGENVVVWLSKGREEPLDVRPDPLGLEEFWPCPRPLYASMTTDSLIPIPDYSIYQDQADELDLIVGRIDGLIRALKVVGVYDAGQMALRRLLDEGSNGTMIPVDSWAAFGEKGGLKGSVDFLPLDDVARALIALYQARDQIKAQIYEISGISDILRGESKASETATAQEIKGRFASLRLRKMQEEVARFAKDLLAIKAQIICNQFSPQTIAQMSGAEGMQEDPQLIVAALQMLKDENVRQFRIEISSDSLTQTDEEAEKQARIEFLGATGQFLEKTAAAAQAAPELMPLMGELLLFAVRGFKVGRSVEGAFDAAMAKMSQPKPPQPNPAQMAMQAEMQVQQAKLQQEGQAAAAKLQIERERLQMDMQTEAARLEAQRIIEDMRIRGETEREMIRQQAETERALARAQIEGAVKKDVAVVEAMMTQEPDGDEDEGDEYGAGE
jgi:hypothetical protein